MISGVSLSAFVTSLKEKGLCREHVGKILTSAVKAEIESVDEDSVLEITKSEAKAVGGEAKAKAGAEKSALMNAAKKVGGERTKNRILYLAARIFSLLLQQKTIILPES